MRDFLFSSEEVHGTYVGFASNAFCYSPSVNKPYFKVESQSDSFKCDTSTSGYYSVLCRGWYQL